MKLFCVLGLLSLYFALIFAQTTDSLANGTDTTPSEVLTTTEKPAPPQSTAGEQTTAQTTTTQAPAPEGNLYMLKEDDIVCILLSADIGFNISYATTKDENKIFTLPSNKTVTVEGSCKSDQYITLKWKPEDGATVFSARMNFAENNNKEQYVHEIILDYELTDELFPGTNSTGKQVANTTGEFFKVSASNQYLCKSNQSYEINDNVHMLTYELNLQAYRTTNSTDFSGDRQQCPADAETNNIVPIAVGAALAALVVIVLIAYLISRNRNKGGYESV